MTDAPAITAASIQAEIASLEANLTPDQATRLRYIITTAEQFAVVELTELVNSKLEAFKVAGVAVGHIAEGYIDGLIAQAGAEFVSILVPGAAS